MLILDVIDTEQEGPLPLEGSETGPVLTVVTRGMCGSKYIPTGTPVTSCAGKGLCTEGLGRVLTVFQGVLMSTLAVTAEGLPLKLTAAGGRVRGVTDGSVGRARGRLDSAEG